MANNRSYVFSVYDYPSFLVLAYRRDTVKPNPVIRDTNRAKATINLGLVNWNDRIPQQSLLRHLSYSLLVVSQV